MPRVPQYEQQVQVKAPGVSIPTFSAPPVGAFGTEVADANAKMGKAIAGIGEALTKHMMELDLRNQEQDVLKKDTDFRKEMQNLLYNQEPDEKGKPKGLMSRELDYAKGVTPEFDEKYSVLKQKYLDSVQTDNQKSALGKMLDQQYETSRGGVIKHEADQANRSFETVLTANMKQRIADAAGIKDPKALAENMIAAQSDLATGLTRQGNRPEVVNFSTQALAGEMAKASFATALEQDPKRAASILEAAKGKIPASIETKMQETLNGKMFDDAQMAAWKSVSGLRMLDGNPDIEKQKAAVMKMNAINGITLDTDKKLKVANFVEAMAKDQMQQRKLLEAAGDHAFKNDILALKQGGGKLEDALQLVPSPKYGPADNVLKAERTEIAKKIWNEKTITDPETYNNLWFAIANGQAGRAEIDAAYKKSLLSASDWEGLGKHWYGTEHKSDDVLMKLAMERVEQKAANSFSANDKKAKGEYIYAVMQQVKGKTPAEVLEYADKLLEKDPNTGFMGFFKKPNYKIENQTTDAYNQATAAIMKDMGSEVTSAILDGKYKGKPGDPVSAMDEFAAAFGGRDKIAPGTNVYRVMKAMQAKGWTVTPETVRSVMKQKGLKE